MELQFSAGIPAGIAARVALDPQIPQLKVIP